MKTKKDLKLKMKNLTQVSKKIFKKQKVFEGLKISLMNIYFLIKKFFARNSLLNIEKKIFWLLFFKN